MNLQSILPDILKALLLAVVLPLFAPILQRIDRGRQRAEARRQLESVKLAADTLKAIQSLGGDQQATLRRAFEQIMHSDVELRQLISSTQVADPSSPAVPLQGHRSHVLGMVDIFLSSTVPMVATFLIFAQGRPNAGKAVLLFGIVSIGLSILTTKFLILPRIKSIVRRGVLEVFASAVSLFPALVAVVAVIGEA